MRRLSPRFVREGGALKVVVNGGFAEVNPQGLTVLADMAVPLDDFDRTVLSSQIKDAEEDVADAKEDWQRDKLSHRLDQLKALQASLG
jgi:F-type H+-transporting ATPase subunit epsilon